MVNRLILKLSPFPDDTFPEPPAGQLRLTSNETATFTADLLVAVSKLFPSTMISTGGDEINANCYAQDEQTQTALNATGQTFLQALDSFTQVTHGALKKAGKTPVVWEGMLVSFSKVLYTNLLIYQRWL